MPVILPLACCSISSTPTVPLSAVTPSPVARCPCVAVMSAPWPQPTQPPTPPLDSRANVDPAWADVEWDYEEGRGEGSSSRRRRTEDGLRKRHPSPPPPSPTLPPTPTSLDLRRRQTIADQAAVASASQQCQVFSGNDVISCFPTAGVSIAQGQWASFVCACTSLLPV